MQSSSFLDLDFYRYAAAIAIPLLTAAAKAHWLCAISFIYFPPSFIKDLKFTFRLIEVSVNFQLGGVNLQTVRLRELPDCYTFNITVRLTLLVPYLLKKNTSHILRVAFSWSRDDGALMFPVPR